VRPLNINFAHTFPASDQTIPIPGLGAGIGPFGGGVFIKVKLRPENGRVHVLIQLQCGIAIGNQPIFPIVLDILKGPLPIDTSSCGKEIILKGILCFALFYNISIQHALVNFPLASSDRMRAVRK
ncbi:hypothetical protein QZH41_010782, partial [Actinostola sp. cb2023]